MAAPVYGVPVDTLKNRLKTQPMGAYLFFGEEEYLKKFYLGKFRDLIPQNGFEEINRSRFDFENKTVADLAAEMDAMPMMSEIRLVEVWGMQPFKLAEKEQARLLDALSHVPEHLILVIYCLDQELILDKTTPKKKFPRELAAALTAVNFAHLTENALINWMAKILAASELTSSEQAARLLVRLCSNDMMKMRGELNKLEIYLKSQNRDKLTPEDVKLFVHGDSDAQTYNLTDAIFARNAQLASEYYEGLKSQRVEPVVIAGSIAKSVGSAAVAMSGIDPKAALAGAGLAEWQMRNYREKVRFYDRSYFTRAMELCLECDRKLKSQGHDGYMLVENLIFTLIKLGVEKTEFYR